MHSRGTYLRVQPFCAEARQWVGLMDKVIVPVSGWGEGSRSKHPAPSPQRAAPADKSHHRLSPAPLPALRSHTQTSEDSRAIFLSLEVKMDFNVSLCLSFHLNLHFEVHFVKKKKKKVYIWGNYLNVLCLFLESLIFK